MCTRWRGRLRASERSPKSRACMLRRVGHGDDEHTAGRDERSPRAGAPLPAREVTSERQKTTVDQDPVDLLQLNGTHVRVVLGRVGIDVVRFPAMPSERRDQVSVAGPDVEDRSRGQDLAQPRATSTASVALPCRRGRRTAGLGAVPRRVRVAELLVTRPWRGGSDATFRAPDLPRTCSSAPPKRCPHQAHSLAGGAAAANRPRGVGLPRQSAFAPHAHVRCRFHDDK